MAVKDDIYYPNQDLILSNPRRHFRTTVNAVHWQLRSLIGAEKDNYVYFATGKGSLNIQRLNRTTHEAETVKRLSFQPRCLVARNGWVCCGGETGEFAAIHVGEETAGAEQNTAGSMDPDDRLPLDLGPEESILASLARLRPEKNILAQSKKVGKDRVNCITMWFPPSLVAAFEGAYSQPVAVLANNDKTVSVVGLWEDQVVLGELTYPDCVNRAVISPDGRLLIAVSDDPYLYIHERVEKPSHRPNAFRTADRPIYEWKPGSFAACFSSTGRFLAVGTQYGSISVFNVAAFTATDVDPLITSFKSSRPYAELGAVRDMAFAPGPIDLLAWTEDRGRVGVADLRSGFVSRQIIRLDKLDDYEHINIVDAPLERGIIDPRLLDTPLSSRREAVMSSLANSLDLSVESRADDTAVLEAFQEQRRRREQRAAGQAAGAPGPRLAWPERSTRPSENSRPSERSASVARTVNDILGNIRDHRERIRDGQERLRASVREADNTATDRDRRRGTFNSSTTGSARATPSTSTSTANSQESERRALVSRLIASNSPPGVSSGTENIEALAAYLMRDMRDWDNENPVRRTYIGGFGARSIAADPYDTSGLSWSDDGQILYVGSENGIYEFHVNLCGRRLFPSMTLR
ncbi:hypothetical protein QBC37DRAFT_458235 [Rhypophila decipiens]|uniref:DUF2415 domain-containing protein n=1 Tax=Rhypophila decipiens TaxID=261697 RepID=A0AAN6YBP3_9PEZI|nr:hypothetical protein QBC37DRAFT_458235 [Rhypophila decipiens]